MPAERLTRVSASAGSGKTYWLTSEFFSLLGFQGLDSPTEVSACLKTIPDMTLSRILAITFTNAAASEMRERIITRLKKAALELPNEKDASLPDSKLAEKWLEGILKDYNALNIRTIDSLLHLIARSSALELGLSPEFDTVFDFREIFDPWLDEIFEKAETDDNLKSELYQVFRALIDAEAFDGFTSRGKIRKKIWHLFERVLLGYFDALCTPEELEQITRQFQEKEEDVKLAASELLECANDVRLNKKAEDAIKKLADGEFPPKLTSYALKNDCNSICKKESAPSDKLKSAFAVWSSATTEFYNNTRPCLAALKKALPQLVVINFAKRLRNRYESEKQSASKIPAILIPSYASRILAEGAGVSDAICKLGTRLTHFLIDEFQDTSREQWQAIRALVLEALANGGTLGAVGDSKQSIYNWRGGDYKIFSGLLEDQELTSLVESSTSLTLPTNRRSLSAIVTHNNKLFAVLKNPEKATEVLSMLEPSSISPEHLKEQGKKLAAIYKDVEQEISVKKAENGVVECLEVTGHDSAETWENSVAACCDLVINNLLQKHKAKDILILCRSNENCMTVAKELTRRKIPVITENSLFIGEHPLIVQTLAFLKFLASQEDDIAFWTLVTGSILTGHPEWNAPEQTRLVSWLGTLPEKPVWRGFSRDFPQLWQKFIAIFLARNDYQSAYDAVRDWYDYLDVENRFPEDSTFLRRFLEMLHGAEQNGAASVADFLEYWEKSGNQEKAPMPGNANAVAIMTVHKAKGLQRKIVIVPKTNSAIKLKPRIGIHKIRGKNIPMPVSYIPEPEIRANEYEQLAFESLNILYVAFTRAEEELYYIINKTLTRKEGSAPKPSLMDFLLEEADLHPAKFSVAKAESPVSCNTAELSPPVLAKPLGLDDTLLSGRTRLKVYRAHPENEELTPIERGNFMHRCLERLNFANPPDQAAEIAFRSILAQTHYAIPAEEREGLLQSLKWFANLPYARFWLENGWREQSLMTQEGKLLRPDLLVKTATGIFAIDYKTGEPEAAHIRQLQNYLNVLEKAACFQGALQGLLVYLDKRKFMQVLQAAHFPLSNDPGLPK